MISFIVIGYNEAKKLQGCFNSIYDTIACSALQAYEIIYVDSRSTDNSLEIAKGFSEIKLFELTGAYNAAIARNVGAQEAKGAILYFIDGDMEVCNSFLTEVLDDNQMLRYDVVSGLVRDIEAKQSDAAEIIEKKRAFLKSPVLDGGVFLIKKQVWDAVGGMRTKFINGEDGDLGLRLAAKGFQFKRLNQTIAFHHTVNYFNKQRAWKMLFNRSAFHCRCVLYRDHFSNKYLYPRIWSDDKTFLLLLLVLIAAFFVPFQFFAAGLLLYGIIVFFRSLRRERYLPVAELFVYFIVFDLLNIVFLFVLFPKEQNCRYVEIKRADSKVVHL